MGLPEDALTDILARLPVKSLIRFTCVCKYWLFLIKSPEFASKHYSVRLSHTDNGYDSVMTQFTPACSFSIFSYENLAFETAFKIRPAVVYEPPQFGIHHRDIFSNVFIYGPCNGLFFLHIHKTGLDETLFLLWNPAIRQVFRLPNLNDLSGSFLGFGFDSETNDYKVVCFDGVDPNSSVVLLYSLAANCWRQIDVDLNIIGYGGFVSAVNCPSICNGRKHHWVFSDFGRYGSISFLLSFDMVDEVFVQTPMPCSQRSCDGFFDQGSNNIYPTIYYRDNMITDGTFGLHIWVLQKYGPTGFWNKQQSLTIPEVVSFSQPKMMWKNKAIVFGINTITCYDLSTQQMKSLRFPGNKAFFCYTESLVSVRPPPPDHSAVAGLLQDHQEDLSVEMTLLQQQHVSPEGVHHHQGAEDSRVGIEFQPDRELAQENHDDGDDSSTDSAFLEPEGTPFLDYSTVYIDYETDLQFYLLRKHEWQKLSKLPYCLREVNKPLTSNPCTF